MPPRTYEDATLIESERDAAYRRTAIFDYWLHIIGAVFSLGTLSLVAMIVNYIQRPSARGSIYESHFTWMIRTCWWTILWVCIFGLLATISLGLLSALLLIPFIWFLYRMIKGLLRANAHQPIIF